nr:integrase, catalytic region, zinc finger, CCHC-type, peptidase aspartic, catalytic [Tanacetum cinerariifolium]
MLDRTDFASWQQRIRLYCRGKENKVNILKSIDEGPFQMGTFRETVTEGDEGALHLGPERPRVYSDLSSKEKERYNADIRATNILLQGLPKDIYTLINHYIDAKDIWDNVKMLSEGSELTKEDCDHSWLAEIYASILLTSVSTPIISSELVDTPRMSSNLFVSDRMLSKDVGTGELGVGMGDSTVSVSICSAEGLNVEAVELGGTMQGELVQLVMRELITELGILLYVKQGRLNATTAMENELALDEEQLLFITGGHDNVDEDVDEQPTMFTANLSFADPVYDETDPSYDLDILSEVHDHDNYQDAVCELHGIYKMHDHVQPNCVVDSNAEYTSNSNMILYDQYVKENAESVEQNTVSFVPHDAPLMIISEMHEQTAQCVSMNSYTKVVDASLTTELAIYREQVELKIAIGYKNPLYLSKAKQAQPALYSGQEIVKSNHACVLVRDSKDTIEIAETTRKQMNEKKKDPKEVHLDYLKHLKESVATLREIVKEARAVRPLDRSLASACHYTKHSQELLEYAVVTCPKDVNKRDNNHASTSLTRNKQVTFEDECVKLNNNTHKHVEQLNIQKTNVPVIPSTGVNSCTDASRSKPRSNTKKHRISSAKRPYQMGTVRETLAESTEGTPQFGPKRPRVYSGLTPEEKDWYNADIRDTNILLQGLPKDIYTLINHHTDVKDIWDNVKMLLKGSELTKEDRVSQLYDDFEDF